MVQKSVYKNYSPCANTQLVLMHYQHVMDEVSTHYQHVTDIRTAMLPMPIFF